MSLSKDIRVVVAIDFGCTFSGFSYAHKMKKEIFTNSEWDGRKGVVKINTVLEYDENFTVKSWGHAALCKKPITKSIKKHRDSSRGTVAIYKSRENLHYIVELFKLHLGEKLPDSKKTKLPNGLSHIKAITDYLREMGKYIEEKVTASWPGLDFKKNVLLILTVPAEWTDHSKYIMKDCIYEAKLTDRRDSDNLLIISEPEAAAIHCMKSLKEHFDIVIGKKFLIVDCGGGTVDLTVRKLLNNMQLGEITERSGDFCGGSFVDLEFANYLKQKIGAEAIELLKEKKYGSYQYMIHEFCNNVKFKFKGELDFEYDFDFENICPVIKDFINSEKRQSMKDSEWVVYLNYDIVKSFFDPVVNAILKLISNQLDASDGCSAMFLVGGFSESIYLQKVIREKFKKRVEIISVPPDPQCAIVKGAAEYGLNKHVIKNRILKYNYGTIITNDWDYNHPVERKMGNGKIRVFYCLARKGQSVDIDQEFCGTFRVVDETQLTMDLDIFVTENDNVKYGDEPGVKLLGKFTMDVPNTHLGLNRTVDYTLYFGKEIIVAKAKNRQNGLVIETNYELNF